MTKQDFELIARVINEAHTSGGPSMAAVAHRFADELARRNPRFNEALFLKACGLTFAKGAHPAKRAGVSGPTKNWVGLTGTTVHWEDMAEGNGQTDRSFKSFAAAQRFACKKAKALGVDEVEVGDPND